MRVFRFWVCERFVLSQPGDSFAGQVYGGSDSSVAEARLDAARRWERVCWRISQRQPLSTDHYEADIREEIVERLDGANVVTRNRYGAEVLNSVDHVFLDIDRPPWRWTDLFRFRLSTAECQRRIGAHVQQVVRSGKSGIQGARVYHTPRGVRLVVKTSVQEPQSDEVHLLMRRLGVDPLYALLCHKQNCYRARLTAKPSRIRLKSLRQNWPVADEMLISRRAWVEEYSRVSKQYAACRFVAEWGDAPRSAIIELHDRRAGALTSLPLA